MDNAMDKFMDVEAALDMETRQAVYNQLIGEDVPWWVYRAYKASKEYYIADDDSKEKYIVLDANSRLIGNGDAKAIVDCMKRFDIEKILYANKSTAAISDLRMLVERGLCFDGFTTLHHGSFNFDITYDAAVLRR